MSGVAILHSQAHWQKWTHHCRALLSRLPQGALASRMSHSCTPNCQAIVMACGGRLTIALYTLRHVYEGKQAMPTEHRWLTLVPACSASVEARAHFPQVPACLCPPSRRGADV